MKFEFKNLGLLDEAKFEVGDLTLICGENNTGKTYATYAVYGFLRSWRQLMQIRISKEIRDVSPSSGAYEFDLHKMFDGKVSEYIDSICHSFVAMLPHVFATKVEFFRDVKFRFALGGETDLISSQYQKSITQGPSGKIFATLTKEAGSSILKVLVLQDERTRLAGLTQFVADAIADIVFSPLLPDVHISSAERTGAAIFRKDLDLARSRMLEAISTIDSDALKKNPFLIFEQIDSGYAWPVRDNVDFVRQLESISKTSSLIATSKPEIIEAFEAVIGGSYKVTKEQGLIFQPKAGTKSRFTMNESSSCVRALLDIGFYLRCKAKPGDLFVIDEPELNLHPRNQRAFARLVVRLVNAGLKVFITTHSDYLIKEFNTLIMLAQKTEHTVQLQSKYQYGDAELLEPSRVRLYVTGLQKIPAVGKRSTRINTLKLATIHPDRGIEVSTFDTTIEEMNEIQNEILFGGDL
jgi:hypothetical protein